MGTCELQVLLHLRRGRRHLAERHLREARDVVRQRVGLLKPSGGLGGLHEEHRWLRVQLMASAIDIRCRILSCASRTGSRRAALRVLAGFKTCGTWVFSNSGGFAVSRHGSAMK